MDDAIEDILHRLAAQAEGSGVMFLSEIGPYILAAASLDLANDSRTFARKFDLAHALVLRECVSLGEELGLITLEDRGERSQRLRFSLTAKGADVLKGHHDDRIG